MTKNAVSERSKLLTPARLKHMKVLVVGLARSGIAACKVIRRIGAVVKATEIRSAAEIGPSLGELEELGVAIELGKHSTEFAQDCDLFVLSPGVALDIPLLKWAQGCGKTVISEIELAYCLSNARFIAVTGTNGKSTTVSLIGHILKQSTGNVVVGGNIGNPISELASGLDETWLAVTEVSSFQLDACITFRPAISVLLNITPDHLDRYPSFEAYAESKARIFANQGSSDVAIINFDDPWCMRFAPRIPCETFFFSIASEVEKGAFVRHGKVVVRAANEEKEVFVTSDLRIRGPHNLANGLAAALAATLLNVPVEIQRSAIKSFSGLEHRLEFVGSVGGVDFVNDSKATNADALRFALGSFEQPLVLIAGGKDKGADFSTLNDLMKTRVKAVVLIGQASEKLARLWAPSASIHLSSSLEDAVRKAYDLASPSGVVLLSPGCASFDMFNDFEHRGRVFKGAVEKLREQIGGTLD